MSMEKLRKNLKTDFFQNYHELGELVLLEFKAVSSRKKLLFIASDHGDELSGTDTLLKKARQLKNKPLVFTDIDIVPVVDIEGYPNNKTTLGEGEFGRKEYLDSSYFLENPPSYIRKLQALLETKKYDIVCMLNSRFQEETTLNGFFVEPQIDFNKGGIFTCQESKILEHAHETFGFMTFPEASDLIGCIAYDVQKGNKLLSSYKEERLGGGYFLLRPGVVLPGMEDGDKIIPKTMLGLNKYCQQNNLHSLALTTISSKVDEEFKKSSKKAHEAAFEAVIKFYQELKI